MSVAGDDPYPIREPPASRWTWLVRMHGRVSRWDYLVAGVLLMALKYLIDAAALGAAGGELLQPLVFLDPVLAHRAEWFRELSPDLVWMAVAWSLPFIWIGVALSARRCADAGLSPWWALLFLVPFVNFVLMLALCLVRTRADARPEPPRHLSLLLVTLLAGALLFIVSVYGYAAYGVMLFMAGPVLIGAFASASYIGGNASIRLAASIGIGQVVLVATLALFLVTGFEGVFCLVMAYPLLAPLALLGSVMAWEALCGGHRRRTRPPLVLLGAALLAAGAWTDATRERPPLRRVDTVVEVDAPPDVVWRRVVAFPDLPAPDGIFRTGIACPLRATIDGEGVGAIRRCEFTTGAFIEPITAWEPGVRLAFAVTAQPPAMRELSPWDVHAPHLDGFLVSERGEFRLSPLPGGRTRLEGTTWYRLDVAPAPYWALWSDGLIHAIHERVLRHIAGIASDDVRAAVR